MNARSSGTNAPPIISRSWTRLSPTASTAMNTATLIPSRILVTRRVSAASEPPAIVRGAVACAVRPVPLPPRTQSGHWNPTDALTMHSGQTGRSQRVQLMPVARSGWR